MPGPSHTLAREVAWQARRLSGAARAVRTARALAVAPERPEKSTEPEPTTPAAAPWRWPKRMTLCDVWTIFVLANRRYVYTWRVIFGAQCRGASSAMWHWSYRRRPTDRAACKDYYGKLYAQAEANRVAREQSMEEQVKMLMRESRDTAEPTKLYLRLVRGPRACLRSFPTLTLPIGGTARTAYRGSDAAFS